MLLLNAVLLAGRLWQEMPVDAQAAPVATENGDVNGDGGRDLSDAVYLLNWLFPGGSAPVAIAQEGGGLTPEQEEVRGHMSIVQLPVDNQGNTAKTIRFRGVNVQIVNGLGATNGFLDSPRSLDPAQTTTNGLGNLVMGYNEIRSDPRDPDDRTGSHNIVVGVLNNYTSFGGLVLGHRNTIAGDFSSVSGGRFNAASGSRSSVSGGRGNEASGDFSSVSGGVANTASGGLSSVSGGSNNTASGGSSSVSGGGGRVEDQGNEAAGPYSTISGGRRVTVKDEAGHAP